MRFCSVMSFSTAHVITLINTMISPKGRFTAVTTVLVLNLVLTAAYSPWFDLFGGGGGYGGSGSPCNGGCNPPPPPNPCPNSGCCQNNGKQCTILLNQVSGVYDIPCQWNGGGNNYVYVSVLNDTCGPQNYEFQQQVISSSNGDFGQYAYMPSPAGSGSYVSFSPSYSYSDFIQTVAFTAIGSQSRVASQTIFITFRFAACYATTSTTTAGPMTPLVLQGPDSASVCAGYPPYSDPSGAPYNGYPQLTMTVINAPPGFEMIWDLASDTLPVGGYGAPNGYGGVGQNWGIYSPAILSGDEANVFVSNMNVIAGIPNTSNNGIYGAGNNGALPCGGSGNTISTDPYTGAVSGTCCQMLRFSVTPAYSVSPYSTGYKDIKVCYDNTDTCSIVY